MFIILTTVMVLQECKYVKTPNCVLFVQLDICQLYFNKAVLGLPWWLQGKESACQRKDVGSIPGSGRSPGGGKSNPLQYSCLENSMDGLHPVHEVVTEQLTHTPQHC